MTERENENVFTNRFNSAEEILSAQNGDSELFAKIIDSNMGLVRSIAVRFIGRGTEYEDLVQIGVIGMIKAIRRFSPEFSCVFSTYAVPMITGEIKRFLRDDGLIKVSREIKRNYYLISKFKTDFSAANGREPEIGEISAATALSDEDIIIASEACLSAVSINGSDEDDGLAPEDIIGDNQLENIFDSIALREAMEKLSEAERRLINLRYFRGLTQVSTAELLNMTQVSVSREEKRILKALKRLMESA